MWAARTGRSYPRVSTMESGSSWSGYTAGPDGSGVLEIHLEKNKINLKRPLVNKTSLQGNSEGVAVAWEVRDG